MPGAPLKLCPETGVLEVGWSIGFRAPTCMHARIHSGRACLWPASGPPIILVALTLPHAGAREMMASVRGELQHFATLCQFLARVIAVSFRSRRPAHHAYGHRPAARGKVSRWAHSGHTGALCMLACTPSSLHHRRRATAARRSSSCAHVSGAIQRGAVGLDDDIPRAVRTQPVRRCYCSVATGSFSSTSSQRSNAIQLSHPAWTLLTSTI